MGFFRRLRAGSTTSQPSDAGSTSGPVSPGASTLNGPNSPSSAYFPTSSSSPRTYATSSPHDRPRPAVLPSSSSSSITSKISRNPWKKKGKSKEDAVAGPSYESTPPRSPVAEGPRTNHGPGRVTGKRDTMVFIGPGAARGSANGGNPPVGSSPASSWGRSVTTPNISHVASSLHSSPRSEISPRKNRIPSGDFGQDGGILGRLGFEAETAQDKDQLWIDTTPRRPSVSVRKEVVEGAVFVDKEEGSALHTEENGVGKMEEEVEVLESAEKKQKFWKGRIRRASKAASDSEDEQPGSPTPRKTTLPVNTAHPSNPVTRSSVDVSQPRPQQLRRPSSSLFHNPFARSVSRTSLHQLELDAPVVAAQDDKSFQLKAFRHISGTSDVEGAGGLEGYLSHVPRESMIGLDMSHNPSSPIEPSSPSRLPPSAYSSGPRPRAPSRGQLTRPPSVAASLASIDDLGSSSRISAAAFRKGIRRPSEGAALAVDDDDDDVPLGMINRPRQMSRNQSALSLSSLQEATRQKQGQDEATGMPGALVVDVAGSTPSSVQHDLASRATPSPRPSSSTRPSPSPSPGPGYPVKRVTPGGRFVVKGVTSSRDVRPGFDRQTSSGQASSYSIPRSASQSPSPSLGRLAAAAPILDETEIIQSPTEMEHQTSHSAVSSHAPKHTRTTSWFEVKDERHNEDHVIRLNDSPVRESPIRPAPPVGPISLPERGNTSPSLNDLPLPPDLMPDTPPKSDKALAEDGATSTSPGKARRISLLEEPLRAISGLWSPSSRDTGPDATARPGPHLPDLSRSVMDQSAVLQAVARQEELPEPPVKSVLFDGTPSISPVTDRSPLSVRLAKAAELSAQARSVNPSASAIKDQVKPQENWMPPDLSPTTLTHFVDQQESKVSQLAPKVEDPPAPVENEETEIVSSFVRARPAMRQRTSSNKAEPKVAVSPVASAAPLSVEPESPQSSFRPPPPTRSRSSLANGRNADAESSESDTESDTSIKAEPTQSSTSRKHPMGPRQRAVSVSKPDDDSSSEEESLAVLRARASRSSLALHKIPSHPSPASPPVISLPDSPLLTGSSLPGGRNAMPASAPDSPRKTVRSLAPHGRGVRHASSSVPPVKSPLGQDTRLPRPDIGGTGSPASSSQSATSESQVQGPMTPRDAASLRRDSLAETTQPQGRPDETRERRQSYFSQQGYFDNQIAAPTHGMEQASMIAAMKQAWQAQFMAAAYRASEDEWERASAVSGTTSNAPSSFSPMAQMPAMPPMPPVGSMPHMAQMNMGYGMPYGFPGMPMPQMSPGMGITGMPSPMGGMMSPMGLPGMPMPGMQGMPWYPSFPSGASSVHGSVGGGGSVPGMYSYGTSAQSVFGGEFGPAQHQSPPHSHFLSNQAQQHAQQQQQHQHQHQQRSTFYGYPSHSQSQYDLSSVASPPHPSTPDRSQRNTLIDIAGVHGVNVSGPPPQGGYRRPKHDRNPSSTSNGQGQAPKGWRNSGVSSGDYAASQSVMDGQWDDAPTPRKTRPSTQYAN